MKYIVQISGWGGYIPEGENLKPWRSVHAAIVEADSPKEAADQFIGKTSPYPLLGSRWEVFELGPACGTWNTQTEHAFAPITVKEVV